MTVGNVSVSTSQIYLEPKIHTPSSFFPIFEALKAEKIDRIMTKIAYEVDWGKAGTTSVNIVTNITQSYVQIVGYMPIVGVTKGVCKLSLGALRLSLAAASLGACRLLGIQYNGQIDDVLCSADALGVGFVDVLPLAVGAGVYMSSYVPSLDIFVSDLKIKDDKWSVVSNFCETTTKSAFQEDPETYPNLKPWAKSMMHVCEKSYVFATEGAECIVTCAAWGDIALGVGALAVSPFTGTASLPYALTSIARGALALGASSLLDLANQYDVVGKIKRTFIADEKDPITEADQALYKLVYYIHNSTSMHEAYEAIKKTD